MVNSGPVDPVFIAFIIPKILQKILEKDLHCEGPAHCGTTENTVLKGSRMVMCESRVDKWSWVGNNRGDSGGTVMHFPSSVRVRVV